MIYKTKNTKISEHTSGDDATRTPLRIITRTAYRIKKINGCATTKLDKKITLLS